MVTGKVQETINLSSIYNICIEYIADILAVGILVYRGSRSADRVVRNKRHRGKEG